MEKKEISNYFVQDFCGKLIVTELGIFGTVVPNILYCVNPVLVQNNFYFINFYIWFWSTNNANLFLLSFLVRDLKVGSRKKPVNQWNVRLSPSDDNETKFYLYFHYQIFYLQFTQVCFIFGFFLSETRDFSQLQVPFRWYLLVGWCSIILSA